MKKVLGVGLIAGLLMSGLALAESEWTPGTSVPREDGLARNFVDENGDGIDDNFIDENGDGINDNIYTYQRGRDFSDGDWDRGTGVPRDDGQGRNFVDADNDSINDNAGTGARVGNTRRATNTTQSTKGNGQSSRNTGSTQSGGQRRGRR